VDDEVRTIVMRGYETARQILQHHRPAMTAVAEQLLEVESLDGGELKAIVDRFATRVN
jgi:ATP-dependent Zn protease